MRDPEQRLWDNLRAALAAHRVFMRRIENMLDDGMPDVVIQHRKCGYLPIELKSRPEAPRSHRGKALGSKFGLRQSQKNWWLEFNRAGGIGWIISNVGGVIYLHDGRCSESINEWSLEQFADNAALVGSSHQAVSYIMDNSR